MTARPRRLPPTADGRAKTILTQTQGAQSAQGATAAARPVDEYRRVRDFNARAMPGLAASATYRDTNSATPYGTLADPSQLWEQHGPATDYFAYNGSDGIVLQREGWYQVAVAALVDGADPGDGLKIYGQFTTPQTVEGVDIAPSGGSCNPTAMSLPFWDDGVSGTTIQAFVENRTGTNGAVNGMSIHLVAFN